MRPVPLVLVASLAALPAPAAQDPAIAYSLAHPADLEETARLVGARGVDTVALTGDVTRAEDARHLVEATTARFGRLGLPMSL